MEKKVELFSAQSAPEFIFDCALVGVEPSEGKSKQEDLCPHGSFHG